jgi:hypothetical protein
MTCSLQDIDTDYSNSFINWLLNVFVPVVVYINSRLFTYIKI